MLEKNVVVRDRFRLYCSTSIPLTVISMDTKSLPTKLDKKQGIKEHTLSRSLTGHRGKASFVISTMNNKGGRQICLLSAIFTLVIVTGAMVA